MFWPCRPSVYSYINFDILSQWHLVYLGFVIWSSNTHISILETVEDFVWVGRWYLYKRDFRAFKLKGHQVYGKDWDLKHPSSYFCFMNELWMVGDQIRGIWIMWSYLLSVSHTFKTVHYVLQRGSSQGK